MPFRFSLRQTIFVVSALLAAGALVSLGAPVRRPPTIVLISIDTLRADHLSSYGYQRKTSPFIDSVAEDGLLFDRAIVPEPQTSPSHASMLTGVIPSKHGVITNGFRMAAGVDTLAAALKRAGYDTAAVVAVGHIGSSRGFATGFNRFSEPRSLQDRESGESTRRDADVVNAEVRRTIDEHLARAQAAPLFLFIHYFDCHYPYRYWDKKEDQSRAYAPEEQRQTAKQIVRYDDGIAWTDQHVRQVVAYIREKLGENVILVITADHGEQIGDHGNPVNHADIYRETVRVPLIIAGPGIAPGRAQERVSILDLPIALARLGGASLHNALDGVDLLRQAETDRSWMSRLFRPASTRSFLVVGGPTYSRSIALVKGSSWYIKNFDQAYRYARIQTPAPPAALHGRIVRGRNVDGQQTYTVDVHQYRPFWVTFEHVASAPGCAASALATIEPGLYYYRNAIPFKGSIRITLPAARLDAVTLSISPAKCAGTTTYTVSRELPAGPPPEPPDIFKYLVGRKMTKGDELYHVDDDPMMLQNILDPTEREALDGELQALFIASASRGGTQKIPPEQLRALRSLGYL